MSVIVPAGFSAAGISAGLKSTGKPDLALVHNLGPRQAAAAVFTSNRAQAHPIIWSRQVMQDGRAAAVILNSGGANCFTGPFGFRTTHLTAETVADQLGVSASDVLVCSTGLIGTGGQEFRDSIVGAIPTLVESLSPENTTAPAAILTTDTVEKTAVFRGEGWSIGAMAKGAGMLAPGLATMLVVITTDADLTAVELNHCLHAATSVTFDRLDSDGCMSTNDQVTLMASGASEIIPPLAEFMVALTEVCDDLAQQLQADAEGSSHNINIEVVGAATENDALVVGRSIARNNLFKAAIFGNDPNWGRVLAAVGTTDAECDPYDIDVSMNGVRVCHQGRPDRPREEVDLTQRDVHLLVDLRVGEHTATIRTNDLTHEYVHENSAYSS
ncbi:bifunctional glutamate N-acetyltransferase/amino-acid acetyltransferase ArgJ [Lysinibacter sp. HNR]|uniref:bifunctional glutamate N-acetyltransferase/amino-acid acetyltransferase ArgJ n=1 Tax=Lysinibacter sp. HNR TaxID=3031408 RepID=UPI002434FE45|nr:bifunctional glutamate N-acetyltransferase/amino-acid acetyltransferase ArgJ [Lysinibacter sp. HNR]WGD37932.1 bifunctional glutamate N-acetyltransferase/amino-acid acetyltransferase ArgJ [Lysinibacter sp. HNR]